VPVVVLMRAIPKSKTRNLNALYSNVISESGAQLATLRLSDLNE